eukprot:CAMPEP_0115636136 /NCGR_PEP_ID=MMETSP0272-20121206/33504_1 /TAXON_ID=71861 /ORGANISM="Scrippsiella trochoidea, Strain CCMP3099" /LENGTH=121 /DNA_ID=CAMNT_0003073113 /DNA_START=162 /DNA_END=525 /DNA_ORIENTATION=-
MDYRWSHEFMGALSASLAAATSSASGAKKARTIVKLMPTLLCKGNMLAQDLSDPVCQMIRFALGPAVLEARSLCGRAIPAAAPWVVGLRAYAAASSLPACRPRDPSSSPATPAAVPRVSPA